MRKRIADELTIEHAQRTQPWVVPYSPELEESRSRMPHLYGAHAVMHAAKSVGKLATVFEAADHRGVIGEGAGETIEAMAADLLTVALRLANLYGFSLAQALVVRVLEKNRINILDPGTEDEVRQGGSGDCNGAGSFRTFEPPSPPTPGACEGLNPVSSADTARVESSPAAEVQALVSTPTGGGK